MVIWRWLGNACGYDWDSVEVPYLDQKESLMRRAIVGGLIFLWAVTPLLAQQVPGKVVRETYEAAFLQNGKVGFYRTTVRELERNGEKVFSTNVELDLTFPRFNATARLRMVSGTDETPDGKVLGVSMKQYTGDRVDVTLTGRVEGEELQLQIDSGRKFDRKMPWNKEAVGLLGQERIYRDKQVKPGDSLSYLSYEPIINRLVTVRAAVKDYEEVDVLGDRRKLLRVEAAPDKVTGPNGEQVPLPKMTLWLGDDLLPVCSAVEMPGLGTLRLFRTTRAIALAKGAPPKNIDIGLNSLIRLNQAIPNPTGVPGVVYRITVQDDDPATTFAQDARQTIRNVNGKSFELHVKPVRGPSESVTGEEIGDEFSRSCYYINSDDARVKELARQAVGDEKDAWKKAKAIERFVYNYVKLDNSAPFTSADQVAANPRGDCRHKAMLSAAMARAAGVPSRTAVGLVYTYDRERGPVLAFHMWTEVAIQGQWLALDATQALGSVGADHVKIADHSWHDTQSMIPLLPVNRVLLAKPSIEVLRIESSR